MTGIALTGFLTTAGLIIAIGSQNAYVLRQGLARRHVFAVCALCTLCEVFYLSLGIFGVGARIVAVPWLARGLAGAGAAFLFGYGLMAFRRAWRGDQGQVVAAAGRASLARALAGTLAVTFLNPHAWLDTVVIIGGIAATLAADARWAFAAGALLAAGTWFFALGFGARFAAPLFARPGAWRVLDAGIGAIMWAIAATLAGGLVAGG